eukprot:CAMPEP_0119391788 /NCGR_PEP_ID=MMETSP1334-20130426/118562_1 /TAXON_ID=127549 /ORGANISM="Calcidiscus leptoporus, Strain RCC1130" /LENGTH=101 /DNA_ID=CAMNT_0007414525 /DNA_START=42 /DNA_END=343 /DNA_ORIENTATION=+
MSSTASQTSSPATLTIRGTGLCVCPASTQRSLLVGHVAEQLERAHEVRVVGGRARALDELSDAEGDERREGGASARDPGHERVALLGAPREREVGELCPPG